MPHLLYDTQTASLLAYPRLDDEPVQGLDSRYIALRLIEDLPPDHDPATEQLEATETIDLTAGEVRRGWVVKPIPPPAPEPQWVAFYAALNTSPDIGTAVETILRDLLPPSPTASLRALGGMYVGLGQAASGGDSRVFLQAWQQAAQAGLLAPEVILGVQQLAQAHNLPAEFVEALAQ